MPNDGPSGISYPDNHVWAATSKARRRRFGNTPAKLIVVRQLRHRFRSRAAGPATDARHLVNDRFVDGGRFLLHRLARARAPNQRMALLDLTGASRLARCPGTPCSTHGRLTPSRPGQTCGGSAHRDRRDAVWQHRRTPAALKLLLWRPRGNRRHCLFIDHRFSGSRGPRCGGRGCFAFAGGSHTPFASTYSGWRPRGRGSIVDLNSSARLQAECLHRVCLRMP